MARRVNADELIVLQGKQQFIRNVCILAHVDHGKTTLSDSLVCSNGIISPKLAGKLRFLDSSEEEQKRGITMKASAISLLHTKKIRRFPIVDLSTPVTSAPRESPGAIAVSQGGTDVGSLSAELPYPVSQDYLINLIDSPGHIDFSSDVSTATRLSDGAIIIVDILEGVCTQTHAVLRQAWEEKMKPCLVLNKMDRLILEVRLTPLEAYWHLQRVLEQVNAISSSLITSETFKLNEDEKYADSWEKEWLFSPERGNVVFASSLYCWAFSVPKFARIWAQKLKLKPAFLSRHLWGNFVFNAQNLSISRYTPENKSKPMFVAMVLDPIWQLYEAAVLEENLQKVRRMIKKLDLEIPAREINPKDLRGTASSIFRRWLPLAKTVLDMVVEVVPNPVVAQQLRIEALWPRLPLQESTCVEHARDGEVQSGQDGSDQCVAEVRGSVASCSVRENAPVVVFVSKVVPMRKTDLGAWCTSSESEHDRDRDIFVAFARVFSGVLQPDSRLYILGPKYHPQKRDTISHVQGLKTEGCLGLFMMMGTSLLPVPSVPAGNLAAIAGLEGLVIKSATLSSTLACPALRTVTLQAKPIVRVAVEVVHQADLEALEKGLAKLFQTDPAVEISVQQSGEHVITALGELHLEQCLKDLRERFARVQIRASAPLIAFRESVALETAPGDETDRPPQLLLAPWSEEEGITDAAEGVCKLTTSSGDCRLTVRCVALPDRLARRIETEPNKLWKLLRAIKQQEETAGLDASVTEVTIEGLADIPREPDIQQRGEGWMDENNNFRQRQQLGKLTEEELLREGLLNVEHEIDSGEDSMQDLASAFKAGCTDILAFGPRNVGPNLLWRTPNFSIQISWAGKGVQEIEVESEFYVGDETNIREWKMKRAWPSLQSSLLVGFQMATSSGPLAEEQMYGVGFAIEKLEFLLSPSDLKESLRDGNEERSCLPRLSREDLEAWLSSRLGSLTGQVMTLCKTACRAAFLSSPVRLVEAFFECDLQCDRLQLGRLYGVLSKRRGRVIREDILEGTDLFMIKALLPVAESFGFATELLKKTSGAATSPQLFFSHWERMEVSPFWRPQNEDDREEFGETFGSDFNIARRYIDETRRRKGLQIGEKLVLHAEKQRTLSRKK